MMDDGIRFKPTGRPSGWEVYIGVVAVLLLFVIAGGVAYLNTRTLRQNAALISHTHDILASLNEIESLIKDAETGQRGYLITGEEEYLNTYRMAAGRIDERFAAFERLTAGDPEQQDRLPTLRARIDAKLNELEEAIALRQSDGFDAARGAVLSDEGRLAMDAVRAEIEAMQVEARLLREQRMSAMGRAYDIAIVSGLVSCALGIVLSGVVAYLLKQAMASRRYQEWLQAGQIKLSQVMAGNPKMETLSENVLRFLAEYLDAHAGAFFVRENGHYRRVGAYGVPENGCTPEKIGPNDGLVAQAAKDRRTIVMRSAPEGYLSVGCALGQSQPRHLIIVPIADDDEVDAVLELGFVHGLNESASELFDRAVKPIASAIRSVNYRTHLQALLDETQRQAAELQAQGEELRVSNEELEEQGRALRESQSQLEQQQAELEQTNVQLEEQTQLLESHNDEIQRSKETLERQAHELEQASQYKSDFLANMSHELRTPLNSSLILAKLLADNPEGNLTAEQVEYAETIQNAGNDLLALIDDILDLSKVEAGRLEMHPEPVQLQQLIDDLARTFGPLAEEKQLDFRTQILPDCPDSFTSDRQRLEQVLKNLLSNAIKFTDSGEVELSVARAAGDGKKIEFSVTDTGIGIHPQQQRAVFEAFRQADGNTNRQFGGTGLGLSISRELARLLGGDIQLASEPGRGSTFTVTIPEKFDPDSVRPILPALIGDESDQPEAQAEEETAPPAESDPPQTDGEAPARASHRQVEDDRDRLTGDRRVVLAVEDDLPFAKILRDLAHDLGFQCLVATTAEEGFAMASDYLPSAILLDVGLPDHSGLSVLDRLKHDRRTRHIPVHVISASDYAQTALSLGAVGYLLKPVKREELAESLKQLENRFAQQMRRVLLVEDDPVQLESLQKLLGSEEVETVGAASAAACLEQLKNGTFDCMVLDLSLPDASGFTLLETLTKEDAYSFPPVIVYTGRDISAEEEQRLRRYSKSIIIKGVKSPERLLDEVTLFIHQVESALPAEQQKMLEKARSRDAAIEQRRILVVEDDVRNVFALTSILESRGAVVQIARNGREALDALESSLDDRSQMVDLVLMDVMMPEMDGITATREIRQRRQWKKLPIIMLTAKAMPDDQEKCIAAGANDYMAKPLDVDKLLSLIRVWMPK